MIKKALNYLEAINLVILYEKHYTNLYFINSINLDSVNCKLIAKFTYTYFF